MKKFFNNLWQYPLYATVVLFVSAAMIFVAVQLIKLFVKFIIWSWCLW